MRFLCLAYGDEKDWVVLSKEEQDALLAQDEALRRRGALVAAVGDATTVRAWDGEPSTGGGPPYVGQALVALSEDGTFDTSDGAFGQWSYDRFWGALTLQFLSGCEPVYSGRRADLGLFRGRQVCTTYGMWFGRCRAVRTISPTSSPEAGTSDRPPS
jgi:hypothetical protein